MCRVFHFLPFFFLVVTFIFGYNGANDFEPRTYWICCEFKPNNHTNNLSTSVRQKTNQAINYNNNGYALIINQTNNKIIN
jgi:hypothetical protein